MNKTAMLVLGGGMRNAGTQALLAELRIPYNAIDAIFTFSSGGPTVLADLSGQKTKAFHLWKNVLTRPEVFNPRKKVLSLFGIRPANIDYLIDVAFGPFDKSALERNSPRFYLLTFEINTAITHFHRVRNKKEFNHVAKASTAYPIAANPVALNRGTHIDGGTAHKCPVKLIYQRGYNRLLIIGNQPLQEMLKNHVSKMQARIVFPRHAAARQALLRRGKCFVEALEFIKAPPRDAEILFIYPEIPYVKDIFTRNPNEVDNAFNVGVKTGKRWRRIVAETLARWSLNRG